MMLTEEENAERDCLLRLQSSKVRPFLGHEWDRLTFLTKKMFHNECLNPHCIGSNFNDDDLFCSKCGEKLFKMDKI